MEFSEAHDEAIKLLDTLDELAPLLELEPYDGAPYLRACRRIRRNLIRALGAFPARKFRRQIESAAMGAFAVVDVLDDLACWAADTHNVARAWTTQPARRLRARQVAEALLELLKHVYAASLKELSPTGPARSPPAPAPATPGTPAPPSAPAPPGSRSPETHAAEPFPYFPLRPRPGPKLPN